jgi:predicted DNA-binding transcriptional regulator AlpA
VSQSLRQDLLKRAPARNPETIDPDRKIQASSVAARYDISVRTLDRWLQKPHLDFPKPVMLMHDVAGRVSARFWRIGDLIEWELAQAVKHAQAVAASS